MAKITDKLIPVGATWETKDDRGMMGRIKLDRRDWVGHRKYELWIWSVCWDDGSGHQFDSCSSYRKCLEEIPIHNKDYSIPRFKRVS
jgi:hypothetical protein